MEEDEKRSDGQEPQTEVIEAESRALSREDILAASREENKNGDERERLYTTKVNSIAFGVGFIFAVLIILVMSAIKKHFPIEGLFLVALVQSVQNITAAVCKTKKRKTCLFLIILGSIEAIIAVFYFVYWILQLCGVI